jgi:CheY-like chemotaxis protein
MNDQSTHVLLIEDNPGDADLVRLRLVEGQSPVEVNCVERLSDGLASLKDQRPSVVLLDLNLPDSQGAETFRQMLEKAPGIPIVILSGQDDVGLAMKALHQGVQDYLLLAALSCLQSFFYTRQEAGFFAEITDNNIGHQPLGGGPGFSGDLRKLGLLLRGEMHFHGLQGTKKPGSWQEDDPSTE